MALNLEGLVMVDDCFEGIRYRYGWQCHNCYTVNFIIDWDIAWQDNLLDLCQNENCKHERCASCDANDTTGFWETLMQSARQDWTDNSVAFGEIERLEASKIRESVIQDELPAESDNLASSKAIEAAEFEQYPGNGDFLCISEEIEDNATFDEILGKLNGLDHAGNIDAPEVTLSAITNELLETMNYGAILEATATPPSDTLLESPTQYRTKPFPCPYSASALCPRTFTRASYARTHSKIHTHHLRCPSQRCRSRFATQPAVSQHVSAIHCLDAIADMPEHCRGRLRRVEGRYRCRFRELLGCGKTFSQNGHANRHAERHAREAVECGVRGCGMRFMERGNWERHFWERHFEVLD